MSTQKAQRMISLAVFMSILNSRKTLKTDHVGQQVLLTIQGNGTFLPKGHTYQVNGTDRTNQYDRTIYNVKANSQLSILREENKELLRKAISQCQWNDKGEYVADDQGTLESATEMFNAYLNNVQVSFSVIDGSSRKFQSGDAVTAFVAEATNEAEQRQIVINDVRYKAPATVEATKFDVSELVDA